MQPNGCRPPEMGTVGKVCTPISAMMSGPLTRRARSVLRVIWGMRAGKSMFESKEGGSAGQNGYRFLADHGYKVLNIFHHEHFGAVI